jgi:SAM-dependent methyltransferase
MSEFDNISSKYEEILNRGISLSGENSEYFAVNRVDYAAKLHAKNNLKSKIIMDYGCGTGGSVPYLLDAFTPKKLFAVDISQESLKILKGKFKDQKVITQTPFSLESDINCDLCFCNGVFHHIMPRDRQKNTKIIYESLDYGGYFYLWENNPWNPATHLVMSRITFDREAVKVFPHQAVRLLKNVGFKVKLIRYFFIFPKFLKFLRPTERFLQKFPLGCQYLIVAQKI